MTQTEDDNQFPVIIIGAGLAGLAAGAHLAARELPPLLIESDALWPGGRLSGEEPTRLDHAGHTWEFRGDHGVHALWGGYANMRALLERFTDTQLQPSIGEEWINRWGRRVTMIEAGNAIRSRWIPAPFHYLQLLFNPQIWASIRPWDFLSLPGFLTSILLTLGVDPLKEKLAWDGLLMDEFFRGWTPTLRTTFEGLATNLLAAPKDEISLAGFIAALRFYTMLRRDSWQLGFFPADGHTSIIQPLLRSIEREGMLMGGVEAKEIQRTENGWRIIVEDSARQGLGTLYAKQIILATDAPGAQRLLCNSPDTAQEAQNMLFPDAVRSIAVRMWFGKSPRPGSIGGMMTGDFRPDNFFWLHRLYPDYSEWHEATGGSAIELHYYDDDIMEMPDSALIVESVTEVIRAFPRLKGSFLHATVRRNSKLHTRFRIPTDESLFVHTPWEGIYAAGDWVGYDTPSLWMERSTVTGIAAANEVLLANNLEPYPLLVPPKPEWSARAIGSMVRAGRFLFSPIITGIVRLTRPRKKSQDQA